MLILFECWNESGKEKRRLHTYPIANKSFIEMLNKWEIFQYISLILYRDTNRNELCFFYRLQMIIKYFVDLYVHIFRCVAQINSIFV